jgi:hypothetical protein
MGSPGKVRRTVTDEELALLERYAARYVGYKQEYLKAGSSGLKA